MYDEKKKIDIDMSPWVKNYDEYVLMKFTSKLQYQQDFLDGKLFFNTSDYFMMCDERGRGDNTEGNSLVVNRAGTGFQSLNLGVIKGKVCLIRMDSTRNPQDYKLSTVSSYSPAENRNRKIISFYTTFVNLKMKTISHIDDRIKSEFGPYGILIIDRQEFYKRVIEALQRGKDNITDAQMGFVEYTNLHTGVNEWGSFKKDASNYGYQNEFRITFIDNTREAVTLDLGCSLRDIAIAFPASEVNNELRFSGDDLEYITWYPNQENIS